LQFLPEYGMWASNCSRSALVNQPQILAAIIMALRQDTLWAKFLSPVIQSLIDTKKIDELQARIDWQAAIAKYQAPDFSYPSYYKGKNYHGIEGGYLTQAAAVTYDPITQYVLPPYEPWVRQSLIDDIRTQPRKILDLGCGTGSMTFLLKQAFPSAQITGLDLSPYMLAVAEDRSSRSGIEIEWRQGSAELTQFASGSFDLITAALLFHETPPNVTQTILTESYRLLAPGGKILILDGNQRTLRNMDWLNNVFEEPYIKSYGAGNLDAWVGKAGFDDVRTKEVFGIHQLTRGVKDKG
jgi:ubiquinone/menaquinone biosynthesis C-methylase UbiE